MRTQECRLHIRPAQEACGLEERTVNEVERVADFVDGLSDGQRSEISDLATDAILPLMREKEVRIRDAAISIIQNIANRETPQGGRIIKRVTKKMVQEAIQKAHEITPSEPIEETEKEEDEKDKTTSTSETQTTIDNQEINETEKPMPKAKFNETNDNIEWAKWTWNPVTGCKHGCQYCYARDIAERFYPEKFEPTFRPERLEAPKNTPIPEHPAERGVFVCSMADLFGEWVPQQWIDAVLEAVAASPEWTFIFLTKNPKRLVGIKFPGNAWVGTTVDTQARVKTACETLKKVNAPVRFLSCEPLMENLTFGDMSMFNWLIIGGRSESRGMPAGQPKWEWVENLVNQARVDSLKVYFKPNLSVRPKEYPRGDGQGADNS